MFHITELVFFWASCLATKVGLAEQPIYHKKRRMKMNGDPDAPSESEREKGTTSYRRLNLIHTMRSRALLEEEVRLEVMIGDRWLSNL